MEATRKLKTDQFTDAELIEKILGGEVRLFEILIRRNNPALYKVGRSYNFNHHDVEDLMQETHINAFLNLSKFEQKSSFKTWIIRIMINQCLAKLERFSYKNEKAGETINEKAMPAFSDSNNSDTSKTISNNELTLVLERSISRLPTEYRTVFALRELNGLSVAETSNALDISESNVKVRLNRAKTMLRQEIEKMYTPEDLFEFNLIYCDKIVERVMNHIYRLCK